MKTIVVQGAVQGELSELLRLLNTSEKKCINGYDFFEAEFMGMRVVVSKTGVGIMNACLATMTAIGAYQPLCVVNQGTAGGHTRDVSYGDIVIGQTSIYLNNMRMPLKAAGEGSNALEWRLGRSNTVEIAADERLMQIAQDVGYEGRVIIGKLGAGDLFSRETDRIDWLHERMGHLCEDMESTAVYKACSACGIPVLGIRIISNNELIGPRDDEEKYEQAQRVLQKFVLKVLERICAERGKE